ncbi:hypothetical protein TraAM80_03734 [Trypanosoma rangeli]|uniref:Uncharacterized protein n=1 Tax=Trypanosoma rangeli TaxID=5698 RepID=A0A3R7KFS8_TRYRA|nr:uncharacterized protein TraAM80_03734 [Trypanosoma rangeli]RNF06918.1 hypothetical protein TraAM80_03734 [Trypanosoma rangeli]|eukprot:RNF06918.1 hypothetical protein TraAM80_03734 [Trypanosoma rangeli]
MSTMQPSSSEFILPSRFTTVRPLTWCIVMDDTKRALAARYGGEFFPQQLPDAVTLCSRDQRMREAARGWKTLVTGLGGGGTRDTCNDARAAANGVSLSCRPQQGAGPYTEAAYFLTERILMVGKSAPSRLQRSPPRDGFPREVPVSLFH